MGIDNGGTACRAVIFNEKGVEVASSSSKLNMITPEAGFTERNMDELWTANSRVIKEAIAKAAIDAKEIKGVACSGHGKGLYLWGKDEKPCYNGIVSTDPVHGCIPKNGTKMARPTEFSQKPFKKY